MLDRTHRIAARLGAWNNYGERSQAARTQARRLIGWAAAMIALVGIGAFVAQGQWVAAGAFAAAFAVIAPLWVGAALARVRRAVQWIDLAAWTAAAALDRRRTIDAVVRNGVAAIAATTIRSALRRAGEAIAAVAAALRGALRVQHIALTARMVQSTAAKAAPVDAAACCM
jgi:hypothetical protein